MGLGFVLGTHGIVPIGADIFGIFGGLVGIYGVASMFGSFLEEKQITVLLWFFLAIALNSVKLDEKIPDAAV